MVSVDLSLPEANEADVCPVNARCVLCAGWHVFQPTVSQHYFMNLKGYRPPLTRGRSRWNLQVKMQEPTVFVGNVVKDENGSIFGFRCELQTSGREKNRPKK